MHWAFNSSVRESILKARADGDGTIIPKLVVPEIKIAQTVELREHCGIVST